MLQILKADYNVNNTELPERKLLTQHDYNWYYFLQQANILLTVISIIVRRRFCSIQSQLA